MGYSPSSCIVYILLPFIAFSRAIVRRLNFQQQVCICYTSVKGTDVPVASKPRLEACESYQIDEECLLWHLVMSDLRVIVTERHPKSLK
jgi:hypothetical protein